MTTGGNILLDPSVCSCFPNSHHYMICNKIKWSTVSISTALIIIIVYASSGLCTLIDVTTLMSAQSFNDRNDTFYWPLISSSSIIIFGWISIFVYFTIALLIIILLCGIQLGKPWLLFLWSIFMIFMLLADGIVTVLSLREHQKVFRPTKKVRILFSVMIIRLIVSLCGIFITIFHFRHLNKAQSEYIDRQRMLLRYNTESASPSFDTSQTRSDGFINPLKDISDDHYIPDPPPPIPLLRAKIATIQRHPTSTILHSHTSRPPRSKYIDHSHQQPMSEYKEDFRYNIPLHERFHQHNTANVQDL